MRTTLTLDNDIAARLERLRKTRDESLKDLVNKALRQGLGHLEASRTKREPFLTESVDLGECLLGKVDNATEILAVTEGDLYR